MKENSTKLFQFMSEVTDTELSQVPVYYPLNYIYFVDLHFSCEPIINF